MNFYANYQNIKNIFHPRFFFKEYYNINTSFNNSRLLIVIGKFYLKFILIIIHTLLKCNMLCRIKKLHLPYQLVLYFLNVL